MMRDEPEISDIGPSPQDLRAANVNPETGLATDFLNPFNEYVMLAEMVETGSMPEEVLLDWRPIDYESHFANSGFAQASVVLAAYRHLDPHAKLVFEDAANALIDLILMHQSDSESVSLKAMSAQRDRVAGLVKQQGGSGQRKRGNLASRYRRTV